MSNITVKELSGFVKLIEDGIAKWIEAGQLLNAVMREHDLSITDVSLQTGISGDIIAQFQRMGNGELNPKLLVNDNPGYRKLIDLPISEQNKYAEEPVDFVVQSNDKTDVIKVSVASMTSLQARQVFAKRHIRTVGEQRAYLESMKNQNISKNAPAELMPYKISKGRVTFTRNVELTKSQIKAILNQMR